MAVLTRPSFLSHLLCSSSAQSPILRHGPCRLRCPRVSTVTNTAWSISSRASGSLDTTTSGGRETTATSGTPSCPTHSLPWNDFWMISHPRSKWYGIRVMKFNAATSVQVGGSLRDTVAEFKKDIARFESGQSVNESHLTFENWQALFNVLTPKRYELLQHIHRQPELTVRALSRALDRDFKRVHADVQALMAVGLLTRDEEGLKADYGAIETRIAL